MKIGTEPSAWAGSIRRRTFTKKLGWVKRPSQSALGSRAIFSISAALRVCPARRYACHCCHDGDSLST